MSEKLPKNQQDLLEFVKNNCYIKNGMLRSKMIWSITLTGKPKTPKYIKWQIGVGIMNPDTRDRIPITQEYIMKKDLPKGFAAVIRTVSGQLNGKHQVSDPTWIKTGKNTGKNNSTTAVTQALLNARSAFNAKIRKGGTLDKSNLILPDSVISIPAFSTMPNRGSKFWRVFPMALHNVNTKTKTSSNWKHLTYPGFIQPKYDGTRFLVLHHPLIAEQNLNTPDGPVKIKIDGYSRGLETYEGQDHILWELSHVLKNYPGLYLDGELWKVGYGLQDVSGSSRRQLGSNIKTDAVILDYYIFDCFLLERKMPFTERRLLLQKLERDLTANLGRKPDFVKFAPDHEYKNKDEIMLHYQQHLEQGLEGSVLRNKDSVYEFGINKELRSHTTLKIKPMDDDEWPVVGFTHGTKGRDVGAVKWILQVTPETVKHHAEKYKIKAVYPSKEKDRVFDAVTKGLDYKQRYAAYEFLMANPEYFNNKLKNNLMSVQFSIISKFGKPQQPKVLGFRDKKLQQAWLHDIAEFAKNKN